MRRLLTERERQILRLVMQGMANKEVARQLGIRPDTVKKHLRNVFEKLEVSRRTSLQADRARKA